MSISSQSHSSSSSSSGISVTVVNGSSTPNTSTSLVIGSKYKPNLRTTFSVEKLSSKYNEIIDILLSPDLELVGAICQLTLVKESAHGNNINISDALVLFFEIHCNLKSTYLLKWAIDKEIECTNNGPTLFRGLSTATRLISAFYKRVGESYLKYLLQPFILDIVSRNFSFEIDPEKAGKGMNIQNNLEKLITITQQVLDKILDSLDQCPQSIRNILHHTQDRVEKKFPFMKTTVIGGFIFLRFICPAIVAPEIFGLTTESPSTDSRRGLVLVSKLLQNLANEMPFGVGIKEEYMQYLNDFITNNAERIHVFFDRLASPNHSNHTNNNSNTPNGNNNTNSNNISNSNGANESISTSNSVNNSPLLNKESSRSKLNLPSAKEYILDGNHGNGSNQQMYTDELIQSNMNNIINQIIDNRERIESLLVNDGISTELIQDIIKKLDSALHSLKQRNLTTKLIPWRKTKSNSSNSNGKTNGHSNKSSLSSSTSSTNINNQHHSNSTTINNHINGKNYSDIHEEEISNSMYSSIQEFTNYYKHKLELKEIELKSSFDEITFLKKESDDSRFRSSIVKKLRDELDAEKRKRRESEILFSRLVDKLKMLSDDNVNEILHDIQIPDYESVISTTDLSTLIEETLEISSTSAPNSTNSTLKKRKSNVPISLKKSTNQNQSKDHDDSNTPTVNNNTIPSSNNTTTVNNTTTTVNSNTSTGNNMKRSVTTGAIAEQSNNSQNLSISSNMENNINQSNSGNVINGILKQTSHGTNTTTKSHSRNNSNSEYLNSEMTSSESNPTFDLESEDRIVQAFVDGELEEDDQGMDLLEFLKEVGDNHIAKKTSAGQQHISVSSSDNAGSTANGGGLDHAEIMKKKRSSMGLFKLPKFSSSSSKEKEKKKKSLANNLKDLNTNTNSSSSNSSNEV